MLVQAPGGTKHARNWAFVFRPLFLAYKLGLETAQTSSGFPKKDIAEPSFRRRLHWGTDEGFNHLDFKFLILPGLQTKT